MIIGSSFYFHQTATNCSALFITVRYCLELFPFFSILFFLKKTMSHNFVYFCVRHRYFFPDLNDLCRPRQRKIIIQIHLMLCSQLFQFFTGVSVNCSSLFFTVRHCSSLFVTVRYCSLLFVTVQNSSELFFTFQCNFTFI